MTETETQDFLCDNCGTYQPVEDIGYILVTDQMVCLNRHDCRTRQALHKRLTVETNRRNMSWKTDDPNQVEDNDQFHKKAKILACASFNDAFAKGFEHNVRADPKQFYVVWFAKTLGNWKALVSTDLISGQYWEVTYNGAKEEAYVDHYNKVSNECYKDSEYRPRDTDPTE